MVLVDRDGTIDRCDAGDYILSPDRVELLPGAAEGLRLLREAGLRLAVVTNQAAIGRGWIDPPALDAIHARMTELLSARGADGIEGIYVCPHRPEDECGCRKPAPGLAVRAAGELGFDLSRSFVVGDRAADVELGRRVGATTILVRTGQHAGDRFEELAHHVAADLVEAAAIIAGLVGEEGA
jgi:D-glycero-D-manno-heptose 1,7-bisphosphate phosphatase